MNEILKGQRVAASLALYVHLSERGLEMTPASVRITTDGGDALDFDHAVDYLARATKPVLCETEFDDSIARLRVTRQTAGRQHLQLPDPKALKARNTDLVLCRIGARVLKVRFEDFATFIRDYELPRLAYGADASDSPFARLHFKGEDLVDVSMVIVMSKTKKVFRR